MNHRMSSMEYARMWHGIREQMYGNKPYIYHIEQVVANAIRYGGDQDEIDAAALHDVLEDTNATILDIVDRFGVTTAYIVDRVTNQESKRDTYERIRQSKSAVFVKLCDRLANVTNGEKNDKYRKDYPMFRSILYRPGEFEDLWQAIEITLAK